MPTLSTSITWTGKLNGNWDDSTANWTRRGDPVCRRRPRLVQQLGSRSDDDHRASPGSQSSSVSVNSALDYSIGGGAIGGSGSLSVGGTGELVLRRGEHIHRQQHAQRRPVGPSPIHWPCKTARSSTTSAADCYSVGFWAALRWRPSRQRQHRAGRRGRRSHYAHCRQQQLLSGAYNGVLSNTGNLTKNRHRHPDPRRRQPFSGTATLTAGAIQTQQLARPTGLPPWMTTSRRSGSRTFVLGITAGDVRRPRGDRQHRIWPTPAARAVRSPWRAATEIPRSIAAA